MATKLDLDKLRRQQLHMLHAVWKDLFMPDNIEDHDALIIEHMQHQSPGVARVVRGALENGYEGINKAMERYAEQEGFEDSEEAYGAAIEGYNCVAELVSYRMFLVGLCLGRKSLKIEDLAPCEHLEVADDEISEFLTTAAKQEGGE